MGDVCFEIFFGRVLGLSDILFLLFLGSLESLVTKADVFVCDGYKSSVLIKFVLVSEI